MLQVKNKIGRFLCLVMVSLLSLNVCVSIFTESLNVTESKELKFLKHTEEDGFSALNVLKDHSDLEIDFDFVSFDVPKIFYFFFTLKEETPRFWHLNKLFYKKVPLWILNLKIII